MFSSLSNICPSSAYGIDVQPKNDPFIAAAEETVHALVKAILPGAFLVDVLPVLRYVPEWLPGAGFKKQARLWRETLEMMVDVPFQVVKRNMVCFMYYFCLVSGLIDVL